MCAVYPDQISPESIVFKSKREQWRMNERPTRSLTALRQCVVLFTRLRTLNEPSEDVNEGFQRCLVVI